jgi:trehalose 6-phosphate synthase/phosphatase
MPRLILASMRLPVTVRQTPDGSRVTESVGGVATGLRALQVKGCGPWVGWPGAADDGHIDRGVLDRQLKGFGCVPVHLTLPEIRGFYVGYANGVLWPLCHYLIDQLPVRTRHWNTYESVNARFADTLAELYRPGDLVWIHDYQLMRVPALLRERIPGARIGFFLHIPFPSFEVFRVLPTRERILEGLLGADLVGFHTAAYARHFAISASELLDLVVDGTPEESIVHHAGGETGVGVFPMGIDADRFGGLAEKADPAAHRRSLGVTRRERLLVGIDRLDYTKGIPRRLLAFEHLLRTHPELREHVTLLQVAVPSRTGVSAYRRLRRQVDAMVGRINGMFGTPAWTPVRYLYHGFAQAELVGLYRTADVMLVTPVRDGMNLVAKEFVASRPDEDGVLLLSEFTGAASELAEAMIVNPYDIDETTAALYRALTMSRDERRSRMQALRRRVTQHTLERWRRAFVSALEGRGRSSPQEEPRARPSPTTQVRAVLDELRAAPALVLLLDYDGTLVPFAPAPELARPDAALLELLGQLAARPRTDVHLVSGRQQSVLEQWFGRLPIGLHAEHGAWSRLRGERLWRRHPAVRPMPYDDLLALLKRYTRETPGALIERKAAGLSWHFRMARPDQGARHAERLFEEAEERWPGDTVEVLRGSMVLEFRPAGVHKGLIIPQALAAAPPDARVVAIGDDRTDEDLFESLPDGAVGIHVGAGPSAAGLRLRDPEACRAFLAGLLAPVPATV